MSYLIGKSTVTDFETWKSNFDENDSYRADHGQRDYQVFRSTDDPDEVVVVFEWDDAETARALFASEEMRTRLADAGVEGEPELTFVERVDERATSQPST